MYVLYYVGVYVCVLHVVWCVIVLASCGAVQKKFVKNAHPIFVGCAFSA
jgi:hypothetical protein